MADEKKKTVIFLCEKKPNAQLVIASAYSKEVGGRMIPVAGQSVLFVPNEFGVGEVRTSDPKIIEFLRGHQWYESRVIYESKSSEPAVQDPHLAHKEKVKQGAKSTAAAPQADPPAPADKPAPKRGGRVPPRKTQA